MNITSLAATAISNSLRSMSRTVLTVVAIVIGAFTLTLTTGVGNGINAYIDSTTSSIGGTSTLTVTKQAEDNGDAPDRYTGDTVESADDGPGAATVEALTPTDLDTIREVDGVVTAEPVLSVDLDYVRYDRGTRYQLSTAGSVPGTVLPLVAGEQLDPDSETRQIALPVSYVDALDFVDAEDAIDEIVVLGVTDADDKASTVTARVVAVVESTLANSATATSNDALTQALHDRQSVGLSTADRQSYGSAVVEFDAATTGDEVAALQTALSDEGYTAETVDEQIGDFKTVIDAVVLILNGFAVVALLAAGFGIVNTLLMSVRERTREIGLWKAMGLGGSKIFAMFSLEAVFIGFLGSLIGIGAAVAAGTVANGILGGGLLAGLPGLSLFAFTPVTLLVIAAGVMGIAVVAGTIPALRAARQDPIESLRYE